MPTSAQQRLTLAVRALAALALLTAMGAAQAQYVWVNDKGIKEFSDRAPPPGTPRSRIIKAPKGALIADDPAPDEAAAAGADASAPPKKTPPTLAERNADFRKRQKEQAEKDKKAGEDSQRNADIAANCDSARQAVDTYSSGVRVGTVDKNGERGFMTDEQRADKLASAKRVLADCH